MVDEQPTKRGKRQITESILDCGPDGMTPAAQLALIREKVAALLRGGHECLQRQILPALRKLGVHVVDYAHLSSRQRSGANKYFADTVFPTLPPLAFDPGRPFPHISNRSLNLAVLIRDGEGTEHFARVKIPNSIPQLVAVGPVSPNIGKNGKRSVRQSFVWSPLTWRCCSLV
jgi:polyphosphate kinase